MQIRRGPATVSEVHPHRTTTRQTPGKVMRIAGIRIAAKRRRLHCTLVARRPAQAFCGRLSAEIRKLHWAPGPPEFLSARLPPQQSPPRSRRLYACAFSFDCCSCLRHSPVPDLNAPAPPLAAAASTQADRRARCGHRRIRRHRGRRRRRSVGRRPARGRRPSTGADGAYQLDVPASVPFELRVQLDGFAPQVIAVAGQSQPITRDVALPVAGVSDSARRHRDAATRRAAPRSPNR